MAVYGDLSSFDFNTGVETRVPVDNAWIRANTRQVLLTADTTNVAVGGVVTITAQLQTMPLLDDTVENVAESVPLVFVLDDRRERLTLDGAGAVTFTVKPVTAGTYSIRCDNVTSNSISITAV
jgi:hypothetical protein